jgi:hypothetical protein
VATDPNQSDRLAARVPASDLLEQARLGRLKSRIVMICTPIARAPVWRYTVALAETCVLLSRLGIRFHYNVILNQSNLPRARNVLVAKFLASDASDLMFIDDDVGWDQADVVRLLGCEQPLIAGAYRRKIDLPDQVGGWSCRFLPGALNIDPMGNVEVAYAATGFMRIHRQVFDGLARAHPEWKGGGGLQELTSTEQPFYHRFFAYDDDEMTEDYVFCDRWRAIGGRVFVDPSLTLSHFGDRAYTGSIKDLIWPP